MRPGSLERPAPGGGSTGLTQVSAKQSRRPALMLKEKLGLDRSMGQSQRVWVRVLKIQLEYL